jgi:hypothetical protein
VPPPTLRSVVREDLHFLRSLTAASTDDELRLGTAVLRRLLVDRLLQRAWTDAGFEREPAVRGESVEDLDPGREDWSRVLFATVATGSGDAPLVGLGSFIAGTCLIVNRVKVSRRVLIKYVANKLGGVHFDPKRGDDAEGVAFVGLDGVESTLNERREPFAQVLGIARVLSSSDDVIRLLAALE